MSVGIHIAPVADGDRILLDRNQMYLKVEDGATTTSITTSPIDDAPLGLKLTLDNTEGTGLLTINSEISVPAGTVVDVRVGGDGVGGKALEVTAPTATYTDISSGGLLQTALDTDKEQAHRTNLPVGELVYTDTLVIDGGTGGGMYGLGRPEPSLTDAATTRNSSVLVYNGTKTAGTAAIEYWRTDFVFQDMVIQGKTTADIRNNTGTRTPRGVYLKRDASVGTGKYEMHNVRLSGFDVAIDSGDSLTAGNCDECSYYNVFSDKNGTLFRSNNQQGLSHKWYNVRVQSTDIAFDYVAGGKLAVTDVFLATQTTLLKLRSTEPSGYGHNASRWVFRGVDLDSQARNSYLLNADSGVDMYAHVVFDGVHLSMNGSDVWDNPGIHVGSNMTVVVNDCFNLPANFVSWNCSGNKSTIIFNNPKVYTNVTTAANIFKTSGSVGNLRCIVNYGTQHNTYALLPVTPDSGNIYNQVLTGV